MSPGRQHAAKGANARGPKLRDLPIGIKARGERTETDSMGAVKVPADRYWGPRRNVR
jgi:fumarate hydratase, class II